MRLSINDVKEIVKKVTNGVGNYTPIEAELARMCLKYRQRIGQIEAEKAEMFNALYSVYSLLNSSNFTDGIRQKYKYILACSSKAHFAEAVKLDKELKEYGNED